ncbi:AAA family ATPase [Arsenicicoccus piscis]|uniref:ATPase AAA-type core domain-containing protein n=1 Tax=Arsenicicoccus piscis TaxID=673954 RepID=A0ABQ6HKJ0_9MICO|nr:AAA family ATPase [Arsenicicoccus piscis]MCH8627691.1 AAA family ATPase [Arsenicicoccus piscis]GMA18194.1 hypothetical protein GCM10025862_02150 [Arsenicicoccus piscis]
MFSVLAVSGYRSLRDVVLPLGRLTVVTGANGTGKSSLYRSMRLLADCGQGRVIGSLAREGGLSSALWAGPESLAGARRTGGSVQGTTRAGPVSLRLGVAGSDVGYLVDLGIPQQGDTAFNRDPEIKRELAWSGPVQRRGTVCARRAWSRVDLRAEDGTFERAPLALTTDRSMLTEVADPVVTPELWALRRSLASWRFYDGFRVDLDAPVRRPQVGTRTRVLADDGADLAAALQTIAEDGRSPLHEAVADAFEGARLHITAQDGVFDAGLHQPGMLRPLRTAELSDGTLRYLLWVAALLTVEPPPLMVLNEPETSLHPSLLAPLARLIHEAAQRTQLVVVTHSDELVDRLAAASDNDGGDDDDEPTTDGEPPAVRRVRLVKDLGETRVAGQGLLTTPTWEWGRR